MSEELFAQACQKATSVSIWGYDAHSICATHCLSTRVQRAAEEFSSRVRVRTDENGNFLVRGTIPAAYPIPNNWASWTDTGGAGTPSMSST